MSSFIIGLMAIIMGILELFYVKRVEPEFPVAKKAFIVLGIITMILGILIIVAYFYIN